jgi:hypothetical protein
MEIAVNNLINDLDSLFLSASSAAKRCLENLGRSLTWTAAVTSVERDPANPGEWSSVSYETQRNTLTHPDAHQFAALLRSEVIDAARICATTIVEAPQTTLPFWAPFRGNTELFTTEEHEMDQVADYQVNPIEWVLRYILLPALQWHLKNLPSLDAVTEEARRAFADDVWRVATSNHLAYQHTIPLAGLNIDDPSGLLTAGDATLRRLDPREQAQLVEDWKILGRGIFPVQRATAGDTEPIGIHVAGSAQPRYSRTDCQVAKRAATPRILNLWILCGA